MIETWQQYTCSLRLVNLLEAKEPFVVQVQATQAIPAATHGAHEVQAEAVDVGFGATREFRELSMAADAYPHGQQCTAQPVIAAFINIDQPSGI